MSILKILKKNQLLPKRDFYTYEFFEHPEELKEALPEKEALLKLPVKERTNLLNQKIRIYHLSPDGDSPVLNVAPYLMRFAVDDMLDLLKGLPEQNQISLLNAPVTREYFHYFPISFLGFPRGYNRIGDGHTVYETCLTRYDKAKKMKNYVSSLSKDAQSRVNKKLKKGDYPYTKDYVYSHAKSKNRD